MKKPPMLPAELEEFQDFIGDFITSYVSERLADTLSNMANQEFSLSGARVLYLFWKILKSQPGVPPSLIETGDRMVREVGTQAYFVAGGAVAVPIDEEMWRFCGHEPKRKERKQ